MNQTQLNAITSQAARLDAVQVKFRGRDTTYTFISPKGELAVGDLAVVKTSDAYEIVTVTSVSPVDYLIQNPPAFDLAAVVGKLGIIGSEVTNRVFQFFDQTRAK